MSSYAFLLYCFQTVQTRTSFIKGQCCLGIPNHAPEQLLPSCENVVWGDGILENAFQSGLIREEVYHTPPHTHTYIYIYTHMYIHTYTHTHTHIYIYIYLCVCVCVCVIIYMHCILYIYIYICVCVCVNIYVCMCVCVDK